MPRVRLSSGDHLDVVPWMQEPMHQLVLENQHTRIYRIRFPAGAVHQTLFHLHTEDTVYLCVSDGGDPATGAPGAAAASPGRLRPGCAQGVAGRST